MRDEWESGDINGSFDEEAYDDAAADRLTGKQSIRRVVYVEEDEDAPEVGRQDFATGGTATATTAADAGPAAASSTPPSSTTEAAEAAEPLEKPRQALSPRSGPRARRASYRASLGPDEQEAEAEAVGSSS